MNTFLFLSVIGIALTLFMFWGFKHLPRERWQMLAVIPLRKGDGETWQGINLTYYGFFIATSQLIALTLLLVLLGAAGISLSGTLLATGLLLAVCIPAARWVAMVVEKKNHTFTIGGASFVGILLAPWCVVAAEKTLSSSMVCYLPLMPVLAAMAIAYTLGEGLGRLGCLSFGCCYGMPLKACSPVVQKLFRRFYTVFDGDTKKVEYEGKLSGEPLVPIQAMTCILYSATALIASGLFLHAKFTAAFLLALGVTQVWRFFSETLRADFRGFGKVTAYQKMGLGAVLYAVILAVVGQSTLSTRPDIGLGLASLWNPWIILALQLAWVIFFCYFGRSTITSSQVSFGLHRERI